MNEAPINAAALNAASAACAPAGALNAAALNTAALGSAGCIGGIAPPPPAYTLGTASMGLALRAVLRASAGGGLRARVFATDAASAPVRATTFWQTGSAEVALGTRVFAAAQVAAPLLTRAGSTLSAGSAQAMVRARIFAVGQSAAGLRCRSVGALDWADPATTRIWSVAVLVDGQPVLATGVVSVDKEEGSATVAQFSVLGAPLFLIDAQVSIELRLGAHREPLFFGRITEPQYDPARRVSTYTATDQLQRMIDALDRASIDYLTPNASTSAGNTDEGWAYLQHRLGSAPVSIDCDRFGAIVRTPWEAGAPLTAPIRAAVDGSERISLIRADGLVNQVSLIAQVSWVRMAQASVSGRWDSPWTLCQFFGYGMNFVPTLPVEDTVRQAIANSGWTPQQIVTEPIIPPTANGSIICNGATGPHPVGIVGKIAGIKSARWTITKRYSRSMQLAMPLTLMAGTSISRFGLHNNAQSIPFRDAADDSGWSEGRLIMPLTADPQGDGVFDQLDVAALTATVQDAVNRAAVSMIKAHRATTITATTTIRPDIERSHRATLDLPSITATGKVVRIAHRLDIDSGAALSEISLCLLQGGNGAAMTMPVVDFNGLNLIQIPTRTLPPAVSGNPVGTYVGAQKSSPTESDSWQGWIINATPPEVGASVIYKTTGFAIKPPDITLPDQTKATTMPAQTMAVGWTDDPIVYH